MVVTFQDVTRIKALSDAAKRREVQQSTVAHLGMLALSGIPLEELMDNLVRQVSHTLNVEYCKVLKYQPAQNNLLLVAGTGWRKGVVGKATVPDLQDSQAGFTLVQKDPVIVERMTEERRFKGPDLLTEHDVVSGMSVVINHSNPPFGVLGVHSRTYHKFNQDDANFLQSISNLLSIAVKAQEAYDALKESESKLRIAKESSTIGAFDYDLSGKYTEWDDILKKIWGLSAKEIPSQKIFWEGVHADDKANVQKAIDEAADGKDQGHYSATYRVINKKNKKTYWVKANGQIIFKDGEPVNMIGMVLDITDIKKSEVSLKLANEELHNVNIRKNQFLATLGHELRNPLAAISGGVDMLQSDPAEVDDVVVMMDRNVERMSSMLDDLLDLARVAKGSIKLEKEVVDVAKLLKQITYENQPAFIKKEQQLVLNLPNHPVYLECDSSRLEQVFSNLLTNARKFTPNKGKVEVDLFINKDKVKICFKDNGIGLDGDLDNVFEPFVQVDPSRGNKGLGIGLSLVKNFVEMHDGQITVESEGKGKGCKFTLTFDFVAEQQKKKSLQNKPSSSSRATLKEGLKVLIVDDNEDAAQLLKIRLRKSKCEVKVAYNATDALKMLNNIEPEIFILDIGLPDMDGNDLLVEIKKDYKNEAIYIAHTGFGHEDAKENIKRTGFDHHLTKPLKMDTLFEILSQVE